jgi:uncharacterized protein (DUF697 family)
MNLSLIKLKLGGCFMNRKMELLEIIREGKAYIVRDGYPMYDYFNIPEKQKKGLLKFDPNFDFDNFVAIYDDTFFNSAKNGLAFMVDGLYLTDGFTRKYLKYTDIVLIKVVKLGNVHIYTKTSGVMTVMCSFVKKGSDESLANLIYNLRDFIIKHGDLPSGKESGKVNKKVELTKDEEKKCHAIIHPASIAAAGVGAGLAQIPTVDAVPLAAIQITMIISLGAVFDIRITEGAAKGIIATLGSAIVGRKISQLLIGWLPKIGNAINATTAAGITQAVGWAAVAHLKKLQLKDKQKGHYEGMKDGYIKACREFEQKFREQAEKFFQNAKVHEDEKEEYLELLDNCIQKIFEFKIKLAKYMNDDEVEEETKTLKDAYERLNQIPLSEG